MSGLEEPFSSVEKRLSRLEKPLSSGVYDYEYVYDTDTEYEFDINIAQKLRAYFFSECIQVPVNNINDNSRQVVII